MSRPRSSTGVRARCGIGGGEELPAAELSISFIVGAREEEAASVNPTTSINANSRDLVDEVEALGERLGVVRERIGEVIFGQAEVVEQALITLLSGGHALLIGVPGLAKTRLVETLGAILGLDDK